MRSKIVPKEMIPEITRGVFVEYEPELPYPFVHYPTRMGVFHAFQQEKDGPLFYCSCQKQGVENYLKVKERLSFSGLPKASQLELMEIFIQNIKFEDNLCHICNKVCPKYGHGKTMNETKFYSIYGYYIKALSYSYGLDNRFRDICYPKHIPGDIVPLLIAEEQYGGRLVLDEQSSKDFKRYCENVIRTRMGYFAIGKKWTSEIKLLELIKGMFPEYTVIHQYELDHLKADIYIEELQLVIEYQGEQHYKPIPFMGGEEGLKRRQERDKEKIDLCKYYNLDLVYVTYLDELSEKVIKNKISPYLRERIN
ncbi:hypothetical protein CN384_05925 [Bacillus thuringiensis]|uniref:hypothetical protein n=1 Tax=Bacillus cereus group TaxID=86661 RepID=UPI000BF254BD|nr:MULTISPECIES: hypothetical protein [Bacillus cereus group]PEZ75089.1 hypothetical protein CN410_13270 [Bacillus anthracis]PFA29278.1 hypothetical protein CN384_05925 [Bacillus thuringiensis]PGW06715.1 hypothetical protein COD97_27220 [Bacillus cereus]